MDKADIEMIKSRVDLVALIDEDIPLKKKGKLYFGLCPFHLEKTPSFAVNPERGTYHCFGCNEHGDHISYLQKVKGLTFKEAVQELANRAGVTIDVKGGGPIFSRATHAPRLVPKLPPVLLDDPPIPNEIWRQHAEKFVAWAHDKLKNTPDAWKYLANRGISLDAIERFRLGWNPGKNGQDLYRDRAAWGLKAGEHRSLCLPIGHVIPAYRDGTLVRVRIRKTRGDPRYFIITYSAPHLLIALPRSTPNKIKRPPRAWIIVESELDAILCADSQDIVGAVGTGSAFAKPDKQAHEQLKQAKRLLIALDNDQAGQKAAEWWLQTYSQARKLAIPQGKDPGEAYQQGVDIGEWILDALPPGFRAHRNRKHSEKPAITPAIRELGQLLKENFNIMIVSENGDVGVCRKDYSPVRGRIAELVYTKPDVTEYLKNHPDEIIDGGNYEY